MKIRSTVVALALCLSLFAPLANTYASARAVPVFAPVTVPIVGTMAGGGTLSGVFTIEKFVLQNGQIFAQGTMTATLLNKLGGVIGTITTGVSLLLSAINVVQQGGQCTILHLELGPLDLNLLGLMVHLDKVVLDITAQQGGGLLGDLLCAIANVLNNPSSLVNLLNNLLAVLRSL
jgi:hypothetical protein